MMEPLDGVITLAGPAGGAGRSSIAVALASMLAQDGSEVLVLELDGRGSASALLGVDARQQELGLLEALTGQQDPFQCVVSSRYTGLSILPAGISSISEQVQLESALADWKVLPRVLNPLREWYHTIIIDIPSGVSRSARAAVGAADEVLVMLEPDPLAVLSLPSVLQMIVDARQTRPSKPELGGIFLNKVNLEAPFFRQMVDSLYERFGSVMLNTALPHDAWFIEAAVRAMPLPFLLPEAVGVSALRRLMDELRERIRLTSAA